jgi:hypothetical protein
MPEANRFACGRARQVDALIVGASMRDPIEHLFYQVLIGLSRDAADSAHSSDSLGIFGRWQI